MDSHITLAGSYEDRPGGSGAWPGADCRSTSRISASTRTPGHGLITSTTRPSGSTSRQRTSQLCSSRSTRRVGCRRPWQALAKLDTRPTRLIAIDNASTDATQTLLDERMTAGRA